MAINNKSNEYHRTIHILIANLNLYAIMKEPLHIDHAEAEDSGIFLVTITDTKGEKEILHHISPDYDKLGRMLFKGMIRSFEVELDYS